MAAMRPTPIPANEWRDLSDTEQRQQIRGSTVTDLDTLDPALRALVNDMANTQPKRATPTA